MSFERWSRLISSFEHYDIETVTRAIRDSGLPHQLAADLARAGAAT